MILKVLTKGSGRVENQSITPGTSFTDGQIILKIVSLILTLIGAFVSMFNNRKKILSEMIKNIETERAIFLYLSEKLINKKGNK